MLYLILGYLTPEITCNGEIWSYKIILEILILSYLAILNIKIQIIFYFNQYHKNTKF